MLKSYYPTNKALLIDFLLSSDAEIFVTKHRLSIQIGAQTCKNVYAMCACSDWASILPTAVGGWVPPFMDMRATENAVWVLVLTSTWQGGEGERERRRRRRRKRKRTIKKVTSTSSAISITNCRDSVANWHVPSTWPKEKLAQISNILIQNFCRSFFLYFKILCHVNLAIVFCCIWWRITICQLATLTLLPSRRQWQKLLYKTQIRHVNCLQKKMGCLITPPPKKKKKRKKSAKSK